MTVPPISARSLLRETFAAAKTLYPPLLIINSPILIYSSLPILVALGLAGTPLKIIDWLSSLAFIFVSGATIFYSYRSLTGNQVNVSEAFQQANKRFFKLVMVNILYSLLLLAGLVALMIPGLYISYRLMFSSYAVVIDNYSPQESIKSSWELTKGHWWLLFRSTFLLFAVALLPIILIALLIDSVGGESTASEVLANVVVFLILPFINIYLVLLYVRLGEFAAIIE